jgi:hypothetical protein
LSRVRLVAPPLALIVVWLVFTNHGPFSSIKVNDLYVYGQYAQQLADGLIPYKDFDFEYPPLALVPIGVLGDHAVAFSLATLTAALVCQECARRITGEKAAWAMVALPLLAGAQVRTHFDLFVVALVMLALESEVRGTFSGASPSNGSPLTGRSSGLLLGAAAAMKLWPGLVAAAILRDRRSWTEFAIVTVSLGLVTLALGGWVMVKFHVERPIQIESTPSSVLSLLPVHVSTTGAPITDDRFKSNGTASDWAGVVGAIFVVLELAAIGWFVWRGPRNNVLAALGVTLAFVALGKVLSPQFLLWLFPLAVAAWGWPAVLVAVATALTQIEFPDRYFDLVYRHEGMIALIAVRNGLLILALLATARALARSSPTAAAPSTG